MTKKSPATKAEKKVIEKKTIKKVDSKPIEEQVIIEAPVIDKIEPVMQPVEVKKNFKYVTIETDCGPQVVKVEI